MKIIFTLILLSVFISIFSHATYSASDEYDFAYIYDSESKVIMLDGELYEIRRDGSLSPVKYHKKDLEPGFGLATAAVTMISPSLIRSAGSGLFRIVRWLWRHLNALEFVKKIRRFLFPRKISTIEKAIIRESKVNKVNNKLVAQRDKIIDKVRKCAGKTSCESMRSGGAPFDKNCNPIQLHHVLQEDDGMIMEILSGEHSQNYSELHKHTNMSEVQRQDFNRWRRGYWQTRATQLCTR